MSDYLSDEEQVERIKRWWARNGTSLVVSILVAISGVVGWNWYESRVEERSSAAFNVYAEYMEQRKLSGIEENALISLDEEYQGTAYQVFTLLFRAKDAVDAGDLEEALDYMQLAVKTTKDQTLKDIALLRLSKLQTQLGKYDSALLSLGSMRGSGYKAAIAELTGDIHYSRGEIELARAAYKAGLEDVSDSDGTGLLQLKFSSLTAD